MAISICIGLLMAAFGYYGWTVFHHNYYQRERFVSDSCLGHEHIYILI